MDGPLSPNSRLDAFDALDFDVKAPDDVAPDGSGGFLVSDGAALLAVDAQGSKKEWATFAGPVSAFARLADDGLIVAVDGDGLRHLDAHGQTLETASTVADLALAGITALAPDGRGGVYFTVGSAHHRAADWVRDLMECNRAGQLGRWVPGQEPELLCGDLAFPAGVLVDDAGHALIVTESWAHRVSRYPIEGNGLGAPRTLVHDLPGYPSRISAARGGGYWLAVFAMRTQLVELILREKAFKRDMMRTLDPALWIRPALSSTGSHLEPLQIGAIRRLGISKPWAPPRSYGLVLRLGADGEVIDSLHSRVGGRCHGITAAREIGDRLFVVSKGNHRVIVASLDRLAGAAS